MAQKSGLLVIAKGKDEVGILPPMANRHGLVAGATGTGKTVTLRVMSEQFSRIGVPVFMADVKGDLSGIAMPGGDRPQFAERAKQLGVADFSFEGCPTVFWDVFGQQGHPIRTTISEMGPLLLSRVLDLNDIQSGVLTLIFKIADDNGLLLLDLKDIKAMAQYVGDNAGQFQDLLRQHFSGKHRRDPARTSHARGAGRRGVLRRAGAEPVRTSCRQARAARA